MIKNFFIICLNKENNLNKKILKKIIIKYNKL